MADKPTQKPNAGGQLIPRFLTTVEVDPTLTPAANGPTARRRRGRPRDGETETIHQYAGRVHTVVTKVLARYYRESGGFSIAQEILSVLEQPFVITSGRRAGWSVSGLAQDQEDLRRDIEKAAQGAYDFNILDPDTGAVIRRHVKYLGGPKGLRRFATDITMAILTSAGRPMTYTSLHRMIKRARPAPGKD